MQAQKVVRPPGQSRTHILKLKTRAKENSYPYTPKCLHRFCKIIGVVPKEYKEQLFCTSGTWLFASALATCMSVPAPREERLPLVARSKNSSLSHMLSR